MLTEYDWPGNVRELMNVVEQMTVRHAGQIISPLELPREMNSATRAIPGSRPSSHIDPLVLFERIVRDGENFWSVVYEPFMLRDLTREHVRQLVTLGLQHSRGSYRALVALMGLPPTDYKRFLNFLRKHQCQVPFHGWRAAPVPVSVLTERQEEPASEGAPRPAAGGRALGRSA
jgi:DNA-binding NtrC family response regulator